MLVVADAENTAKGADDRVRRRTMLNCGRCRRSSVLLRSEQSTQAEIVSISLPFAIKRRVANLVDRSYHETM